MRLEADQEANGLLFADRTPKIPLDEIAAVTAGRVVRAEGLEQLRPGTVLLKFDGLWQRPFPYILAFHQAPTDGRDYPEAHLHAEFYPAFRMPGRPKYLAGSEIGAAVFTADTLPEDKAAELRGVAVHIDA